MKALRWSIIGKMVAAGMLMTPLALSAGEVTLMSYNVKNGSGMDNKRDYDRTARVIREQKPDIVALQELDNKTQRSGKKDVLAELARRSGLTGTYAKAIDYSGGEYGIGLLSREKPLNVRRVSLPGREEGRVLLMAEFKDYCFCVTHLSLTKEDRESSLDMIAKLAAECKKPFLIAGDFNMTPDSAEMAKMKKNFTLLSDESWKTFPADKPTECLDYIWKYKGKDDKAFTVKDRKVVKEPTASDHRPIKVVVKY